MTVIAMTTDASSVMLEQAMTIVSGAQTEIAIFFVALITHAVIFGKHRVAKSKAGKKTLGKRARSPSPENHKSSAKLLPQAPRSPRAEHIKALAQKAESICRIGGDVQTVKSRVKNELDKIPQDETVQALAALLEGAGRFVTGELLGSVRSILKEKALQPSVGLGDSMLRCCLNLQLLTDFEEILDQVEKAHGSFASISFLALKAALRANNFDVAMARFESLHGFWQEEETASMAPTALLRQLVRLAVQNNAFPTLLRRLYTMDLMAESLNVILADCVQRQDVVNLKEAEKLARVQGVQLTSTSFSTLIKGCQDAVDAERYVQEAVSSAAFNKEVLTSATDKAMALKSEALARLVLANFPRTNSPVEVAGKLLGFLSTEKPDSACTSDAKLVKLYKQYLSHVDLAGDTSSEKLVAEAALRCGQKDIIDKMLRLSTDSSKRVSLIKSFSSGGPCSQRVQHALQIFQACPEKASCLYNAIMEVCVSSRDLVAAEKIMSQATKAKVADIVTYNTMVKAYLSEGSLQLAKKAIVAMQSAGFQPNCVTFNELLDSAVKRSIGDAWIIVEEMDACGVKPNHITCSILLKSIQRTSKASDVERILEVLDNMDDDIDEVLLSSVVEACIRVSRADLLIPQLKRQRSSQKVQVKGPHTYGSIIRAYGFVGDVEGVWDTWREMRTRHIMPTSITLGCMVEALTLNGDPEAGYELICQMLVDSNLKSLVNAVIYCSVLKGFSHQKRFDRVWAVYQEMLGLKLQFSIVTFNTLIDACARSSEMARIPAILESMVGQGIQPNVITYSAILKGYCQENRLDEAFQVLQDMLQTTSFKPDEIMYNTLLDGCARQGQYDRGMKLLREMQDAGIRPSNFTLSVLVKLASRGKMLDRAFELCKEISETYKFRLNTHVYSNLVQACIMHNDLPRALSVLVRMLRERVRPEVRTYSLLIKGYIADRDGESAASLVRSAAGLKGGHQSLASFASHAVKPQGHGLPTNLLSEFLEGIAFHDHHLAMALVMDLKSLPNLKLPPQLQLRLAAQGMKR